VTTAKPTKKVADKKSRNNKIKFETESKANDKNTAFDVITTPTSFQEILQK
jgi:hypothetical protein